MIKKYLETGEIVGTHGINGEVRVQPWCDSPDFLIQFKHLYTDPEGQNQVDIISARVHKNIVLLKLKNVDSIESAEKLRGKVLYLDRGNIKLDPGENFIQDLIGCQVFDAENGGRLGELTDVYKTGANDVWQVSDAGRDYLVPVIPEVVGSVDTANSKIVIKPLKGIFDNDD